MSCKVYLAVSPKSLYQHKEKSEQLLVAVHPHVTIFLTLLISENKLFCQNTATGDRLDK